MVSRPGVHARRQFFRIVRRFRHVEYIETKVGAGHAEHAVLESDIRRRDFEHMRGELLALADDDAARFVERRAADRDGARAAGEPRGRAVGVAHDDVDAVGIDAELVGDELLVGGVQAGAVFLIAHHQFDAIVLELDRGGFGKAAAAALGIGRHADAAQHAFALALARAAS